MNQSVFYLTSLILSAAGIFFLWHLGLKKLMLDDFRDSLFATRDRLYALTQDGRLSCDSDAYRAVELFVNSLIQYAHRFTFLTFILSVNMARSSSQRNRQSATYTESMIMKIKRVEDEAAQAELNSIVQEVTLLLPRYIAKSSVAFMASAAIYFALHSVSPLIARGKQKAVAAFEREAYRAAEFDNYAHAG